MAEALEHAPDSSSSAARSSSAANTRRPRPSPRSPLHPSQASEDRCYHALAVRPSTPPHRRRRPSSSRVFLFGGEFACARSTTGPRTARVRRRRGGRIPVPQPPAFSRGSTGAGMAIAIEPVGRAREERALLERLPPRGRCHCARGAVERFLPLARSSPRPLPATRRAARRPDPGRLARPRQGDRPIRPGARDGVLELRCRPSSASSSATSATPAGRCACPRDLQELAVKVDRGREPALGRPRTLAVAG